MEKIIDKSLDKIKEKLYITFILFIYLESGYKTCFFYQEWPDDTCLKRQYFNC